MARICVRVQKAETETSLCCIKIKHFRQEGSGNTQRNLETNNIKRDVRSGLNLECVEIARLGQT